MRGIPETFWRGHKRKSSNRLRHRPALETSEDHTLPSEAFTFVESINRTTPVGPAISAATVAYTVTFNEPATSADPIDFKFVATGTGGPTLIQVTAPGPSAIYPVTVSGITGNCALGVNLIDANSIHDLAGDALSRPNQQTLFNIGPTFAKGATLFRF